jgi:hypothetical protein
LTCHLYLSLFFLKDSTPQVYLTPQFLLVLNTNLMIFSSNSYYSLLLHVGSWVYFNIFCCIYPLASFLCSTIS